MSSGQGEGRTTWWMVAGAGALLLAPLLTLPVVHDAWHWLGWWHWVVLALLLGLAGLGVVHLLPTGADAAAGGGRDLEEDRAAVDAERARLTPLPLQQLVLEVSRDLRRDGWEDAHVEPGGSEDDIIHVRASRGATSLVVGCRASGDGFVAAPAVRTLAARVEGDPLATAVLLTTGGFTNSATVTAEERGVVLLDGEATARWVLRGPSAWPVRQRVAPDHLG